VAVLEFDFAAVKDPSINKLSASGGFDPTKSEVKRSMRGA